MKNTIHPSAAQLRLRRLIKLPALVCATALLLTTPALYASVFVVTQTMLDSAPNGLDFSGTIIAGVPNTVVPSSTIAIQAHTRSGLVLLNIRGKPGAPVTITNSGGQLILQKASDTDPYAKGIRIIDCHFIKLEGTDLANGDKGIKVANTGKIANTGTTLYPHPGVRIRDNETASSNGSTDAEVSGIEIANTTFAGIMAKWEHPALNATLYVASGSTTPYNSSDHLGDAMYNINIHDNYIHDTQGEGMYLGPTPGNYSSTTQFLKNIDVHDNILERIGWDGIQLNNCTQNGKIYDNIIVGFAVTAFADKGDGFTVQNEGIGGGENSQVDVYNNKIVTTGEYEGTGIFLKPISPSKIYNNIIINRSVAEHGRRPEDGMYIGTTTGAGSPVHFIANNTIVKNGGNGIKNTGVTATGYNNIISGTLTITYSGTITDTGTAMIKVQSSPTNLVKNVTESETMFVNYSGSIPDLHLVASSVARNSGTNLYSQNVTEDYDGVSRPASGNFDIGAYQYVDSPIYAVTVLTPYGFGQVGTGYCPATGAFDAQPSWDSTNLKPVGDDPMPHSTTTTNYANRYWYVDFGPNYNKVHISSCWTRYRPNSPSSDFHGFAALWWSSSLSTTPTAMTESNINFATATGTTLPNISTQAWDKDMDNAASPVVPQARYLIISTGTAPSSRANEFVFVGYVTP